MQLTIILVIIGVILGIPGTVYAGTHQRQQGQPFTPERRKWLALTLLGGAFIVAAFVVLLVKNT